MRINKKAQSVVEYIMIGGLVLAGIFVMGPYIISAVNDMAERVKDDTADAILEQHVQAPVPGFTADPCSCEGLEFQACGDGTSTQCLFQQEYWGQTCTPPGCELSMIRRGIITVLKECRPNDTSNSWPAEKCCKLPYTYVDCGSAPGLQKCCGTDCSSTPYGADCQVGGNYAYSLQETVCGASDEKAYQIVADAECVFTCTGGTYDRNATPCPGTEIGLTADKTWETVSACNASKKCEALCNSGFEPDACTTTQPITCSTCDCEGGLVLVTVGSPYFSPSQEKCVCPMGQVDQGDCSAGFCEQKYCGAGECEGYAGN